MLIRSIKKLEHAILSKPEQRASISSLFSLANTMRSQLGIDERVAPILDVDGLAARQSALYNF